MKWYLHLFTRKPELEKVDDSTPVPFHVAAQTAEMSSKALQVCKERVYLKRFIKLLGPWKT